MIPVLLNFVVFATGLYLLTRKPITEAVAVRHKTIREDVESTRDRLRTAQAQYDEFSAKLRAVDAERAAVADQGRNEARQIRDRIVSASQALGQQVVADAKTSVQGVYDDLRHELRVELATRVMAKAEDVVRKKLTGDDRARIRKEFSSKMEAAQ